jgi:protocatechuate 3,4-dioxygenase beta subunit
VAVIARRAAACVNVENKKRGATPMIAKTDTRLSRRSFVGSVASIGLTALAPRAFADETELGGLRCTPLFVTSGPYYPTEPIPWASDLTRASGGTGRAKGQVLYVLGKVTNMNCDALSDSRVEVWQSDATGRYKHPVDSRINQRPLDPNFRYFSQVTTKLDGFYLFKTVVPSWYEVFGFKRCAHLHFRIKHPDYGEVTTQMMFEGKEDDELRKVDEVFKGLSDYVKPQVVVAKQAPGEFPELAERLKMEPDAVVCRFDQSFI